MKSQLAKRLLADLMAWDTQESTRAFNWLDLMVSKFDHYQGYGPGDRFYVNLLYWLTQFETPDDKRVAYDFLRNHLVFVSQQEMHHLIALSFPMIQQVVRRAVARKLNIKMHNTWTDPNARRSMRHVQRRTLYVGLSDGARIDVFRRMNEGEISNEQVVASSEITQKKWGDLVEELRTRLKKEGCPDAGAVFERLCLIDDFTGSGATLIRFDSESKKWGGKVLKFCESIGSYTPSHIAQDAIVHLHHYLASERAESNVHAALEEFTKTKPTYRFDLSFSSVLRNEFAISDHDGSPLAELVKRHYDPTCETTHLGKDIWLGYRQCGLPLVLDHNTPNNSIALLWASSKDSSKMRPLFPRKQRHVDHGQSV